jgi:hypothetical protein
LLLTLVCAENEQEVERVALALRQSIKVLTRNLQDNPNLEGNMQKIQNERGAIEILLVNTAHELQVCFLVNFQLFRAICDKPDYTSTQYASFNSLDDVVEKEQRRIEHVRVVLAREKELSDSVARMKQKLAEERAAFESEAGSAHQSRPLEEAGIASPVLTTSRERALLEHSRADCAGSAVAIREKSASRRLGLRPNMNPGMVHPLDARPITAATDRRLRRM